MSGTFLDSGYLIALVNKRDNLHEVALEASSKFHGPFFTTHPSSITKCNRQGGIKPPAKDGEILYSVFWKKPQTGGTVLCKMIARKVPFRTNI